MNTPIIDLPYLGMPFHFWSVVFFVFGCVVGSFLNVVIHRLPLGQSIVHPPSHCPHCNYAIPWFLNIPLVTWLYLRGKCANCHAPISIRYFLVELLTGVTFLGCWLSFGQQSAWLPVVYCIFMSGMIAGTFIDFEHFIIPDEITLGGIVVGFLCSFLVPQMHGVKSPQTSLLYSLAGIAFGGGLVYLVLRMGKLLFGQQKIELAAGSKIIFTETSIILPGEVILYEELFYRKSDFVKLQATRVELIDHGYAVASIQLTPNRLTINDEELKPEDVPYLEAITDGLTLPREAMGLGDVKFMAAIGAFLGPESVLFSLVASSVIGSVVGLGLIALKKETISSRLPYVPYIALGAALWLFGGNHWWHKLWAQ